MARQKRRKGKPNPAAVKWAAAILLIASGFILALSAFGLGGTAGGALFESVFSLFGIGVFVSPVVLAIAAWSVIFGRSPVPALPAAGAALIAGAVLTLLGLLSSDVGGTVGAFLANTEQRLFGFWGAIVLSLAVGAVGAVITVDIAVIASAFAELWNRVRDVAGTLHLPSRVRSAAEAGLDGPPDQEPGEAADV